MSPIRRTRQGPVPGVSKGRSPGDSVVRSVPAVTARIVGAAARSARIVRAAVRFARVVVADIVAGGLIFAGMPRKAVIPRFRGSGRVRGRVVGRTVGPQPSPVVRGSRRRDQHTGRPPDLACRHRAKGGGVDGDPGRGEDDHTEGGGGDDKLRVHALNATSATSKTGRLLIQETSKVRCAGPRDACARQNGRMRVLIVEDDPSVADGIADALAGQAFEVASARDGVGGLALARTFEPEIVLLDLLSLIHI